MTDPRSMRSFLLSEVEALEPFDFVMAVPAETPLHAVEIQRREEDGLEVHVPGRPLIAPELAAQVRDALREREFASEDASDRRKPWVRRVSDAASAVELAQRVLTEVFEEKPDATLDVAHGSRRIEHEARERLEATREHVERVLRDTLGGSPARDADGDYVLPLGDVHVTVAPRIAPGGVVVVRVFAITNVGVTVAPELGLFLARLNFGLVFGRFALDAEHRTICFDETLLGDHFSDEELRFVVKAIASTADQWDDRLKQMFGGVTFQEVMREGASAPTPAAVKPGEGGYL